MENIILFKFLQTDKQFASYIIFIVCHVLHF